MKLTKKLLGFSAAFVLVAGLTVPVQAATTGNTEATVTINPGVLEIVSAPIDLVFPAITIDGTTQTIKGTLGTLAANDFRGVGDGWKVDVQATQFESTFDALNKLEANILKINGGAPTISTPGTGNAPTYQVVAPTTIDGGSGVSVISAAIGDGKGSWDVEFQADTLDLVVDTNQVTLDSGAPTVFTSTVTWTVSVGP